MAVIVIPFCGMVGLHNWEITLIYKSIIFFPYDGASSILVVGVKVHNNNNNNYTFGTEYLYLNVGF